MDPQRRVDLIQIWVDLSCMPQRNDCSIIRFILCPLPFSVGHNFMWSMDRNLRIIIYKTVYNRLTQNENANLYEKNIFFEIPGNFQFSSFGSLAPLLTPRSTPCTPFSWPCHKRPLQWSPTACRYIGPYALAGGRVRLDCKAYYILCGFWHSSESKLISSSWVKGDVDEP